MMKKKEMIVAKYDNLSDTKLLSAFQEAQNKTEMADILRELFDEKKIQMIGDLSKDEIRIATKIYILADMKKIPLWKKGLEYYMKLLLSRDRKSRKEILEAIRGYQSTSFLQKMNPFNRKDRL